MQQQHQQLRDDSKTALAVGQVIVYDQQDLKAAAAAESNLSQHIVVKNVVDKPEQPHVGYTGVPEGVALCVVSPGSGGDHISSAMITGVDAGM